MNKFYNNEDDFLRHKLVEHEFDALPQAWEQMSALLDSQPVVAKRAAGYYWWGAPIAALIIGAASGIYYYNKKPITIPSTAVTTTPMALQNKSIKNTVDKKAVSSLLTTTGAATGNTATNNNGKIVGRGAEERANNNESNTTALDNTVSPSAKRAAIATKNNQQAASVANNTPAPTAEQPILTPTPETNENIQKEISIATTPITTPRILSEEQQHRVRKRRTEIVYQYSTTPLRALQEKRQQELGTFGIKEEVDFKKSPIKFGVVVGASTQLPAISPEKVAFRPVLGAQVSAQFAKRHSIQVGTQYKNLAVDTDPTIEKNNYIGDQSQHQYIAHPIKGLHLIEFPVVYKVHPHPKYNLQAGVKPTVLLGVDSDAPKSVDLAAANTGVSSWDLGVLLGAEYSLNKHWSIGIQYTLGLVNMAQNAKNLHTQSANDPIPAQSISKEQDLLVPVGGDQATSHYIRVPEQVKNSDLQLLLKYNF
ncbi:MAG: outer membrane beta-barrel protein [Aureispira sp.]